MEDEHVHLASHIIHLADRIDILISSDEFILDQKEHIDKTIAKKVGTIFHPDVYKGFQEASQNNIFWIEINNMTIDQLFKKLDFSIDYDLTIDNLLEFALTISQIIDFRSRFTATHSYSVAHLAGLIGSFFDCSEDKCKQLMIAGYLHDIGKIGIDPAIIEKNGPLTDDEFNKIKLHPYFTGQILSELNNTPWFSEIVRWAERHHEKADGKGYPYGLEDSELDLGVKILAFSDIIVALMEERPYRASMSVDEAFKIIDEQIAETLSVEMFEVIKQYKDEVSDIVLKSQQYI